MSRSGIVPGGSLEEDERPTGRFNFEDWVGGLQDHLTTASISHPEDTSHLVDSGIKMTEQGQAVTSTPKRGIPRNANSNGGQQLEDLTHSQQSIPAAEPGSFCSRGCWPFH